jgi:hypothetical protein
MLDDWDERDEVVAAANSDPYRLGDMLGTSDRNRVT